MKAKKSQLRGNDAAFAEADLVVTLSGEVLKSRLDPSMKVLVVDEKTKKPANDVDAILKFWLVWNPQGRAPTHRHYCKEDARTEACRLAGLNPGQTFIVLAAVDAVAAKIAEPAAISIRRRRADDVDLDGEIPL